MFERWLFIEPEKSSLIIGPRRCGKTTLLRSRFPDFHYVTLDDLDYFEWAKRDPKGFISELGTKAIIDEIQRLPILTIASKYVIDNFGAIFMMTGSSSIGLLDSTADTLAGRINIYSLPTACWGEDRGQPTHHIFSEELSLIKLKEAQRQLPDAITFGQFPEVITQPDKKAKEDLLINYRNTYFTRDLMQLANIENLDGLYAIFVNLARSIGSHLEVSNFAREAGVSFPTAKKYLNSLFQSQLIFKLHGYQYGPAKRYIKAAKTYFADNGIIYSLRVKVNEGQLIENFVIAELEKRRKLGFIQADKFYYYKSAAGREIDLIWESNNEVYAVEIKTTSKPGPKDVRNLVEFGRATERPVKLFLFYTGDEYQNIGGVKLIPIAALYRGI